MKIWIDADACPAPIKDIVFRAAERVRVQAVLVANKAMRFPRSPYITLVQVSAGLDVADAHIAGSAQPGDLAITADIPLAALLVPRGVIAIDPRGELYTESNIGERLSIRNFMQDMRGAGLITGGPSGFGEQEKRAFAAVFDRELTRALRASVKAE